MSKGYPADGMEQTLIRMIKRGHLFLCPLNEEATKAMKRLIDAGTVIYNRKSYKFTLSGSYTRSNGDGV